MKIKFVTCIAVALFSMNIAAQSSQNTVAEVMQQTGLNEQLPMLDEMILSKLEEKKSTFPKPEQFEQLKRIITSGMNSANAKKFITEYMVKYSNEDSLKMVVKLYRDSFMQEITRIENESSTPAMQKEVPDFFENLKTTPPSPVRIQLLTSLNTEMKGTEITVKMIQHVIVSIIKGANNILPLDKKMSDTELKSNMDSFFQPGFSQQITNQLVAYSLFIYRDVSNEKMNRYLEVWKAPTGKYCMDQIFKAYDFSFSKMGEITGGSMSELETSRK